MNGKSIPPNAPVADRLLDWYDANARDLPWRIGPAARKQGAVADPYAVWLSEIMLQQTTVATVAPRYRDFLDRWPTVNDLAAALSDDVLGAWAGLGYYARARNLHRCAQVVAEAHGGVFPQTEEALLDLPGIGAYTAAAIAAIAFDEPAVVVDGNIERVMSRLFLIETPLPKSKPEIKAAAATIWPDRRSGDFAQALMDLGAGICKPKNPQCEACPLMGDCAARKAGVAETLPKKKKKAEKPVRLGAAFVLFNADGSVLLERRPDKGLLGGMLGFPGTDWTEAGPSDPAASAPEKRRWRTIGEARHTFTHFHLRLAVMSATATRAPKPDEIWMSPADARLPTVMKKALDLAIDAQGRLL